MLIKTVKTTNKLYFLSLRLSSLCFSEGLFERTNLSRRHITQKSCLLLNPIQNREGGGRILPARTLDVYNFLNKQAKATKLGDFS